MRRQTCWICGKIAQSREHKAKNSDIVALFGNPSRTKRLNYYDKDRSCQITNLQNNTLKYSKSICTRCNDTKTQPCDRAWELLSKNLRSRNPFPIENSYVKFSTIFDGKYQDPCEQMLNVHLYFVKHIGCNIEDGDISIDLSEFSRAIMNNQAHPNVYLKFGYKLGENDLGATDWESKVDKLTDNVVFMARYYYVGNLNVLIMYAQESQERERLIDAWHPHMKTDSIRISYVR